MTRHPPRSTLFPYTPLSRSQSMPFSVSSSGPSSGSAETKRRAATRDHPRRARSANRWFSTETPSHTCGQGKTRDRKSTRLNSSHLVISYAVFCLKKKQHIHEVLPHAPNLDRPRLGIVHPDDRRDSRDRGIRYCTSRLRLLGDVTMTALQTVATLR